MSDPARLRLPPRREGEHVELVCLLGGNEFKFVAGFKFYDDGKLGEVFARPFKTGAGLESLLDKFCIAVSRMLQRGDDIAEFWRSVDDGTDPKRRDIFSALLAGAAEAQLLRNAGTVEKAGLGHA